MLLVTDTLLIGNFPICINETLTFRTTLKKLFKGKGIIFFVDFKAEGLNFFDKKNQSC